MALTRPSLTVHLTSGMGVFAHACGQKADTLSNYFDNIQPYDKRHFSFCQMWHDFYIFFVNYHKFELLQVVRQYAEGMVGSIIWVLLEI